MAKLFATLCLSFAFFVASAVAQMAPGGSQGTQSSSPSMSQPGAQTQPGDRQGQQPGMDQSSGTTQNQNNQHNGEHKLKGCVQSQGGQYVLETKKGKEVALAGQDVSAHVGHEVSLKGTWESGSGMSATSSSNSGTEASSGKTFNVTDVKMVSDTCKEKSGSSGMSNSGNSSSGSTAPSSTAPSSTGTTQQPPQ
jgi:hypothetical protein